MKRIAFDLCQAGYCEHPEVVTIKGGSFKSCQFPSLFGVIEHPDAGVLLYDTGYHPLYAEQTSRFPEGLYPRLMPAYLEPDQTAKAQLQRRGIAADDVTGIVISHFHGDHVAGLRDFPRAKFYALKSAFANVDGKSRWRNLLNGYLPGLLPDDFRERVVWIDEVAAPRPQAAGLTRPTYDLFGDGALLAVELAGHKSGQVGLRLQDERRGDVFLIADAAWSRRAVRELRPPQGLALAIMDDRRTYHQVLRELHELEKRNPELRLVPSHCVETYREFQAEAAP